MITNKILGYVLLVLGLALIGWTLWQSYDIFTAKSSAPLIFRTQPPAQTQTGKVQDIQAQLQAQMNQTIQQQLGQILPAETITKVLNLLSWPILAGVLIFGGSAISGIGVKLIKS